MSQEFQSVAAAKFADREGCCVTQYADIALHPEVLHSGGLWFVAASFEGQLHAWRFTEADNCDFTDCPRASATQQGTPGQAETNWQGPAKNSWVTNLSARQYTQAITSVRHYIRAGEVYQVNICRLLSATFPERLVKGRASGLHRVLNRGNPAPHSGYLEVSGFAQFPQVWVVSASPELFLRVCADGTIASSPIKGTANEPAGLTEKDRAENIMITDLVRNDLQQICLAGSVETTALLQTQSHPGLVHLVSTVQGQLRKDLRQQPEFWAEILNATFPPASVSGAPKISALRIIQELEPQPRGVYCGAFGWLDADAGTAELAVGIRSFYHRAGRLWFGTGAGITWGSDPWQEWQETELKATRLISLCSSEMPNTYRTTTNGAPA